jgi:hypothetical protein
MRGLTGWRPCCGILAVYLAAPIASAYAQGPAADPIAAWSVNGGLRRIARDIASNRHHASARSHAEYVASPGGKALVFDGATSYLVVENHSDLVMRDAVTLDAWVWLDELESAEPQCLIDKGGERYRLQINPGGQPMLGLKNDEARFDLGGGRLEAGRWHRITGVFGRPKGALYVDGELVAEGVWDQAIGPGEDLYIGAKSGVTYFLKGRLDELRIYNYARPPQEADSPTEAVAGVAATEAKMEVSETAGGGVTIDTGAAKFELTKEGGIASVTVEGNAVVAGNTAPLLAATVLESAAYDGWRDYGPGRLVEATYQVTDQQFKRDGDRYQATYVGRLDFGDGDAIQTEVVMQLEAGSPFATVTTRFEPRGEFRDRFLRALAVRLPLALNKRKRVVQAGDRGVQWDTRHWYQFHVSTTSGLLEEPDHNIWRHFVIDQQTDHDYHIWRAESDVTSPLWMQRGIAAPGWMAAYDERAGLLFAYRDLAERAPKSLWVNADGAGEALIYLWSPTSPALDLRSPQATAVFGEGHVTDWMPFSGEFRFVQPDLALAEQWGVQALSSDAPPRNEIPAGNVALWTAPSADAEAPLVSGGIPFPKGALTDPTNVRLRDDRGAVPLQAKPLAYWPDKSIKWLLLTFPADGGQVAGDAAGGATVSFDLTRRDGSRKRYSVDYGGGAEPGAPSAVLRASQDGDTVEIDTGPLQLGIGTGREWLRSATLNGREMLASGARSYVDFLRTEQPYACGTSHAQGELDDGAFVADSIQLEEAGPLRAVVRLEGMTGSEEPVRMILRLEAYAGRTVVRVFQSVEFLHKDPRVAFVRRMGIDLPVVGLPEPRVTVGGQDGPVEIAPGRRAGIRQHSHLGYTAWSQAEGERFQRVVESKHRCRGWLDLAGEEGGVAVALREMWQQFPNELVADLDESRLTIAFWPESGAVMDVRRYSNYPHQSQGESCSPQSSWVAESWYPNDCFVGVSKTHEALLYFHGPEATAGGIDSVVADFQRPPLVYAGPQWYHDAEVLFPHTVPDPERFARCDANLEHFAQFWMHHQRLWGWYGMWDYGDVQHYFKGGYGRILAPDDLRKLLAGGEAAESVNVRGAAIQDYRPNHDWAFDNGRWGWTNTEGLPNLFLQTEYLRTGSRELYFFIEAMARHVRDVDMRHDGKWLGLGTRHGVQHWSDGNHEERQTTHSEFRYHHYLSGDMRSRDFAKLLYDRVYSQRDVRVHAAHSGRLQGLLTQWEMTGSDEVAAILGKYVPLFHVEGGLCESPRVHFPDVTLVEAEDDINAGNMFFWTFGAAHGLIEYCQLTGNEAVRQALIETADDALAKGDIGLRRKAVVFAAHHADDPARYREAIEEWVARGGYRSLLQMVPHNPTFYSGPRGMLRGSVAGALFTINDLPYVMTVLDGDPEVTDELRAIDENGGPYYGPPVLSWQSEYDLPEFEEYLRIKHPQP